MADMNGSQAIKLVFDEGARVSRRAWRDEDAPIGEKRWIGSLHAAVFGAADCSIVRVGVSEARCPMLYAATSHVLANGLRQGTIHLSFQPELDDMIATD